MSEYDLSNEIELFKAIEASNAEDFAEVRRIIESSTEDKITLLNTHSSAATDNITPLILAAANGNIPLMDYLLSQGACLKQKDVKGRSALLIACYFNQNETANHLVKHHAIDIYDFKSDIFSIMAITDLETSAKNAKTFFEALSRNRFNAIVDFLKQLDEPNKKALLTWKFLRNNAGQWCVNYKHIDLLTLLLSEGFNLTRLSKKEHIEKKKKRKEKEKTEEKVEAQAENEENFDDYPTIAIHALLRLESHSSLHERVQLAKKAFFTGKLKKHAKVLASILKACKQAGPYQHHDKQILIDGLMANALCAGENPLNIDEVVFSPLLSEESEEFKRMREKAQQLAIITLADNAEFLGNLSLLVRQIDQLMGYRKTYTSSDCQSPNEVFLYALIKALEEQNALQKSKERLQKKNSVLKEKNQRLEDVNVALLQQIARLEQQVAKCSLEEDLKGAGKSILPSFGNYSTHNAPQSTSSTTSCSLITKEKEKKISLSNSSVF